MDIEAFLEAVGHKRYGGNGTFSKDDEVALLQIVEQNPCRLDAQLLLVECAHYNYPRFFSQFWTVYYKEAVEKGLDCWKPDELAEIYCLGHQLYFYDQNNEVGKRQAALKAFEIAPNHPKSISIYLNDYWKELLPQERLKLIRRITSDDPKDPHLYYRQASYFEEYAAESGEEQYLELAKAAYQKSIELGMDRPAYGIPRKVVEEKIKRLRESSNDE